jgi:uncharacterized membrane protein
MSIISNVTQQCQWRIMAVMAYSSAWLLMSMSMYLNKQWRWHRRNGVLMKWRNWRNAAYPAGVVPANEILKCEKL